MVITQLWRLTLQGRAQAHRIAVAQLNPANAAIAVKQPIGGVEILQGKIAVAGVLLLEDGVHPAQARFLQRQLTGWIAA